MHSPAVSTMSLGNKETSSVRVYTTHASLLPLSEPHQRSDMCLSQSHTHTLSHTHSHTHTHTHTHTHKRTNMNTHTCSDSSCCRRQGQLPMSGGVHRFFKGDGGRGTICVF